MSTSDTEHSGRLVGSITPEIVIETHDLMIGGERLPDMCTYLVNEYIIFYTKI